MNLRDLNYLVAVTDLRSFVQAAEQCCISQPTLSTQIKNDVFLLAVASDNPLAQKATIEQADLYHHQMLLLEEGHCLRGQALQICQLNNIEEQQDVRATGLETLRQMVRAGTGITFMPKIAIHEPEDGICYIPFVEPAPTRTIGLVWRKTSVRKQLMEKFTHLITEIIKQ